MKRVHVDPYLQRRDSVKGEYRKTVRDFKTGARGLKRDLKSGSKRALKRREGNYELIELANRYLASKGMPQVTDHPFVAVDPERGKRIAAAYDALPTYDPGLRTAAAYGAFKDEIDDQYDFVVRSGLIDFDFTSQDPYPNSAAMRDDVRENHRLRVFTGGEPHPFLGDSNNKFRAIHDLFGHAMWGYEFGPSGEENAWLAHAEMFTPLAQRAMTTETRGQNSWFNYSTVNIGKPTGQKVFAEQKTAILPREFWPPAAQAT